MEQKYTLADIHNGAVVQKKVMHMGASQQILFPSYHAPAYSSFSYEESNGTLVGTHGRRASDGTCFGPSISALPRSSRTSVASAAVSEIKAPGCQMKKKK